MKNIKAHFLLLNIYNCLDIITTSYALEFCGARELNPFMHYIIENYGLIGFSFFKLFLVGFLSYGIFKKGALKSLVFCNCVYTFVILNNIIRILF